MFANPSLGWSRQVADSGLFADRTEVGEAVGVGMDSDREVHCTIGAGVRRAGHNHSR